MLILGFFSIWRTTIEQHMQLTVSFENFSCAACIISRPSFLWFVSTKLRYDSLYFSGPKSPFSKIVSVLCESPDSASLGSFLPKSITLDGNLQAKYIKINQTVFFPQLYVVSNVRLNNCILGFFQNIRFSSFKEDESSWNLITNWLKLLTFPDHNPPFPHTAFQACYLPVAHCLNSPEQQNPCPMRNLSLPKKIKIKNKKKGKIS